MSNYATIKDLVQDRIKTNGQQTISGASLQQVLLAVINSLGAYYQFVGIATPSTNPGTPDQNVAYLAGAGTYSNMGNLVVDAGKLAILKYNGSWSKEEVVVSGSGGDSVSWNQIVQSGTKIATITIGGIVTDVFAPNSGGGSTSFVTEPMDLTLEAAAQEGQPSILKLADRHYNPATLNGMGYVILRQDADFDEQVTLANTIYEIRYDFDLNSDSVNIPANCILRFNGGSLSNGTLSGNNYLIEADRVKIFENMQFTGRVAEQAKFMVDWFTDKTTNGVVTGTSVDAYSDIMSAINSGINNLVFSADKFYPISQTIVISGHVDLYSTSEDIGLQGNGYRQTRQNGCIYSQNTITLLRYNFSTNQNQRAALYIGAINFYCIKQESDTTNDDVPIVEINNVGDQALWGVILHCNITDIAKDWTFRHTGLIVKGQTNGIAFVSIFGNIQAVANGFIMDGRTRYVNDVSVYGNTRCYIGGVCLGSSSPLNIYGGHQPEAKTWANGDNNRGYFEGRWVNQYSYIWDTQGDDALDNNVGSVRYQVKITTDANTLFVSNKASYFKRAGGIGVTRRRDYFDFGKSLKNILQTYSSPDSLISDVSYTIAGESIFDTTKFVLYNRHNLFNGNGIIRQTNDGTPYEHSSSFKPLFNIADGDQLIISFSFGKDRYIDTMFTRLARLMFTTPPQLKTASVLIVGHYRVSGVDYQETIANDTISPNAGYYTMQSDVFVIEDLFKRPGKTPWLYGSIDVTITYSLNAISANSDFISLPMVCIPMDFERDVIPGGLTANKPVFSEPAAEKGFQYFDIEKSLPYVWDGSQWKGLATEDIIFKTLSGYGEKYVFVNTQSNLVIQDTMPTLTDIREMLYVPYNASLSFTGATNMIVAKTENWKLSGYGAIGLLSDCKVKKVDVSTLFVTNQPGNAYAMFSGSDIEEIYGMDLWDTNANQMGFAEFCYNCQKLRVMDLFPIPSGASASEGGTAFYNCKSLTTINRSGKISASISFGQSPLTRESALVLINALDSSHTGTLTLSTYTYNLLTADDIAIGTNKGWTITH